jgi:hypothetical protein
LELKAWWYQESSYKNGSSAPVVPASLSYHVDPSPRSSPVSGTSPILKTVSSGAPTAGYV